MNSFEEFMNEIKNSSHQNLQSSSINLPEIQKNLAFGIAAAISPLSFGKNEKEQFSEEVSNLIQDESFISEFSDEIGKPLENESEEDFIKRSSLKLKQMLYTKFNIKG